MICSNYTFDSIETSDKSTSISQQNNENMATYERLVFEIMVLNWKQVFIFWSNCVTSVTFVNLCKSFDFFLWILIKSNHSSKTQWQVFFQCHEWKFLHLAKWQNAGSNFRPENRNKSLNFFLRFSKIKCHYSCNSMLHEMKLNKIHKNQNKIFIGSHFYLFTVIKLN